MPPHRHTVTVSDDNTLSINDKRVSVYVLYKQIAQDVPTAIAAASQQLTADEVYALNEFAKDHRDRLEAIYVAEQQAFVQRVLRALSGKHRTRFREQVGMLIGFLAIEACAIVGLVASVQAADWLLVGFTGLLSGLLCLLGIPAAMHYRCSYYVFNGTHAAHVATLFRYQNWSIAYSDIAEIDLQSGPAMTFLCLATLDDEQYFVMLNQSIQHALRSLSADEQWMLVDVS